VTRADLLEFIRSHTYAVQASVSPSAAPQAAVVGVVVTDRFELFFDTNRCEPEGSKLSAQFEGGVCDVDG